MTAIEIHAVETGSVKVKAAQRQRRAGGLLRVLAGREWTDWLPIYAWLIDHPEGPILVDTGETARTSQPGYFPAWHPYYRLAVQLRVEVDQEIDVQLRALGVAAEDVRRVVMTHLHTDHAGGLHHFPHSEILVAGGAYRQARGVSGRLQGYLPQRWPSWFAPTLIEFPPGPFETFERGLRLTEAGDVWIVATPGHTPHHLSVLVVDDGLSYVLAGDTSYSQALLLDGRADGVSPNPRLAEATLARILAYARIHPTVYLPTHDPDAAERLRHKQVVEVA